MPLPLLRPLLLLLLLLFRNGDAGFPLRVQPEPSERTKRPIPFHDDELRCIMDAERKMLLMLDGCPVCLSEIGESWGRGRSPTLMRNNLSSLNSFCVLSHLVKLKEHVKLDSLAKYISLIVIILLSRLSYYTIDLSCHNQFAHLVISLIRKKKTTH